MARKIKETPVLKGKDAKRFLRKMKEAESSKIPKEDLLKMQKDYEKIINLIPKELPIPIYVIIECGYEGIKELVYATADSKDAANKIKELRQDIICARKHRKAVLKGCGKGLDENFEDAWFKQLIYKQITQKQHDDGAYRDPDSYCVQMWNGTKFSCACVELKCEPSKEWLM